MSQYLASMGPTASQFTIITEPTFMRKKLCGFTDEFPLIRYPADVIKGRAGN